MHRVTVSNSNTDRPCHKCGRELGDVGDYAYWTAGWRGKHNPVCAECGDRLQDSLKRN